MATWGPIQLRLKGSRQVEFEGEASPAPGGGAMPVTENVFRNGSAVAAPPNMAQILAWQHNDGATLLDYTDPTTPVLIAAGTYAVCMLVQSTNPSVAGGSALLSLSTSDPLLTNPPTMFESPVVTAGQIVTPSLSQIITVTAGANLQAFITPVIAETLDYLLVATVTKFG